MTPQNRNKEMGDVRLKREGRIFSSSPVKEEIVQSGSFFWVATLLCNNGNRKEVKEVPTSVEQFWNRSKRLISLCKLAKHLNQVKAIPVIKYNLNRNISNKLLSSLIITNFIHNKCYL